MSIRQKEILNKIVLLLLLLPFVFLLYSYAHSATTGSITISGTVPSATAIVVTPSLGYNNLNLTTTVSDLVVCQVREINNTVNGFNVTLSSANSGQLKNGTLGQKAYTAKYNGSSVTLTASPVNITTQGSQTGIVNQLKDFSISYTGSPSEDYMQGTYSDILTFTIQSN